MGGRPGGDCWVGSVSPSGRNVCTCLRKKRQVPRVRSVLISPLLSKWRLVRVTRGSGWGQSRQVETAPSRRQLLPVPWSAGSGVPAAVGLCALGEWGGHHSTGPRVSCGSARGSGSRSVHADRTCAAATRLERGLCVRASVCAHMCAGVGLEGWAPAGSPPRRLQTRPGCGEGAGAWCDHSVRGSRQRRPGRLVCGSHGVQWGWDRPGPPT